jgi:hypothetical protein
VRRVLTTIGKLHHESERKTERESAGGVNEVILETAELFIRIQDTVQLESHRRSTGLPVIPALSVFARLRSVYCTRVLYKRKGTLRDAVVWWNVVFVVLFHDSRSPLGLTEGGPAELPATLTAANSARPLENQSRGRWAVVTEPAIRTALA